MSNLINATNLRYKNDKDWAEELEIMAIKHYKETYEVPEIVYSVNVFEGKTLTIKELRMMTVIGNVKVSFFNEEDLLV